MKPTEYEIKRVRLLGKKFKAECKRNDEHHAAWERRTHKLVWKDAIKIKSFNSNRKLK